MRVLSLFDGISCGRLALERAGIPVERYVAYEIDKNAIKVSKKNWDGIEYRGDVTTADFSEYKGFDTVIGGSPCTWWSNARSNRTDRETTTDGIGYALFSKFVEAVKKSDCKYFLYENNYSISREIKEQITKDLGVQFCMINSALVSAQNRKRCYWTNIPVTQLDDKNIFISDVIDGAVTGAAHRNQMTKNGLKPMVNIRRDGKSNCLISYAASRNCEVQMNTGEIRPLTADEFELLQTLPIGYTSSLCESARKKVVALGWTVDVIAHILSGIPEKDR